MLAEKEIICPKCGSDRVHPLNKISYSAIYCESCEKKSGILGFLRCKAEFFVKWVVGKFKKKLMLVFIVDKSTSMGEAKSEIIHEYRRFLAMKEMLDLSITTVLFSDDVIFSCKSVSPKDAKELSYDTGGGTALYNAIYEAICYVNDYKRLVDDAYSDTDVLYVIISDGADNSNKMVVS